MRRPRLFLLTAVLMLARLQAAHPTTQGARTSRGSYFFFIDACIRRSRSGYYRASGKKHGVVKGAELCC